MGALESHGAREVGRLPGRGVASRAALSRGGPGKPWLPPNGRGSRPGGSWAAVTRPEPGASV